MPIQTSFATLEAAERLCGRLNTAAADPGTAADKNEYILTCLRSGKYTPMTLPSSYFRYIFSVADSCGEAEYEGFRKALLLRVTPEFYQVGLAALQQNPDSMRVEQLFDIVLRLMEKLKPAVFAKTLFARCGLPIANIYTRFFQLTVEENALPDALLQRYGIETESPLADCLRLAYTAECPTENIGDMNDRLPQAIHTRDLRFVRPVVRNYMQLVAFSDIPVDIVQAIYDRLMSEDKDETLGMTREALEHIRSYKFRSILLGIFDKDSPKLRIYSGMPGSIVRILQYEHGFFSVEFTRYTVLDNSGWPDAAYAIEHDTFTEKMAQWKQSGYDNRFWKTVLTESLPTAHDVLLKLRSGTVIRLGFDGFDRLYTKDILTKV